MSYRGAPYDDTYYYNSDSVGYSNYEKSIPRGVEQILNDFEVQCGPVSGLTVADIGCAFGFYTNELVNRGADATGYDISSYAISKAQTLFPSIASRFVELDCTSMTGVSNNTFDRILCLGVMICMPDNSTIVTLFNELARVMKPGGAMYFGEFHIEPTQYPGVLMVKTMAEWEALATPALPGKTITVSDISHLPLGWDVRIVVT